jgi:hypothetical protein
VMEEAESEEVARRIRFFLRMREKRPGGNV